MTFLHSFASINLIAALIILLVLATASIFNKKYVAGGRYFIWIAVMGILLLPFISVAPTPPIQIDISSAAFGRVESGAIGNVDISEPSVLADVPTASASPDVSTTDTYASPPALVNIPTEPSPTTIISGSIATPALTYPPSVQHPSTTPRINIIQALIFVWLIGIGLSLGVKSLRHSLFLRFVHRWSCDAEELRAVFDEELARLNIRRKIRLMHCKGINAPMLFGLVRPIVLLNNTDYSIEDQRLIIRHELTHYKRRDLWYMLAIEVIKSIYWFNPAVFLMARQAKKDLEITCDALVVRGLDIVIKKKYSNLILSMAAREPAYQYQSQFATCMKDDKGLLKQRFEAILGSEKKLGTILFSTIGVIIAGVALFVGFNFIPHLATPADISPHPMQMIEALHATIPTDVINDNAPIEGGTLRVALSTGSSFTGLLDPLFTTGSLCPMASDFIRGPNLFTENPDLTIGDRGMARIDEWCHETQSILIVMQHEVFWHDGVQLTLDDLVFAYEVISHPDYTGTRWTGFVWNVVGTHEFRVGERDYISGLVLSDCRMQLRMYFSDWNPSLQYFGFWHQPSPRHHLEHIPVAVLPSHENVRANTLGFGPFMVESYIPGPQFGAISYTFVRNGNYWLGMPGVERVVFEILHPDLAGEAIENGEFDIIHGFRMSDFEDFPNPTNFQFIGYINRNSINYHAFVQGYFDEETQRVVLEPDRVMSCIYLRRAMAMAVPHSEISRELFSGLLVPAVNNMPLFHEYFFDPELNFYRFNPEEARRILDLAGYAMGADGFRRRPCGGELIIYMLYQNPGSTAADERREIEMQSFRDIGLNVQLYRDRHPFGTPRAVGTTVTFPRFGELVNSFGPVGFDVIVGGWSVGNNPNPTNLWGPYSRLNMPRFTSPQTYYIFTERLTSDQMWDRDFSLETYRMWQRAVYEEVPFSPTTWGVALRAVNNRVQNFSAAVHGDPNTPGAGFWWLVQLTADEPYRRESE